MLAICYQVLPNFNETYHYGISVLLTFSSIFPSIICVCYTCIVIKVRCGAQPHHHGAASRERKLTMTLLLVTVVSLLLYLPHVLWLFDRYISKFEIQWSLSSSVFFHLDSALLFLLYANSVVNPILYAIRMPEYRSAFLALFRRRAQHQRQVLPLRDM